MARGPQYITTYFPIRILKVKYKGKHLCEILHMDKKENKITLKVLSNDEIIHERLDSNDIEYLVYRGV